jgi:predicted dehydrogenase
MRKVRLVQVGLGFWGYNWAKEVLPTVEEIEVAACVDVDPAVLARAQAELGVPVRRCFTSLAAALDAVECDAVLASLPTRFHASVAREAIEAGKHVIVEKPFVPSLAEGAELVAQAEARGLVLMVSQNYRFYPASIAAAELVAGGSLGRVLAVALDFRRYAAAGNYFYWDIPDPLLADMSIHHFDLLRMVLGEEPAEVSARTWNPGSPFKHHCSGALTIVMRSGLVVSYRGSWSSRGAATPWGGEWQMDLEAGAVLWTCRGDQGARLAAERLAIRRLGGPIEEQALAPIRYHDRAGATAAFAAAITSGVLPPRFSSGRDNLRSLALVEAAIHSARERGRWVRLDQILPASLAA